MTWLFVYSAGVILALTGIAKLWSGLGHAHLLAAADPVLNLPFRYLMISASILELLIAGVCLSNRMKTVSVILVAWLATSLLAYRVGLWRVDWHRPCPCLGNLTDALHIAPQTADTAMKIILAYLLIGSYASLFRLWRQRKKAVSSTVGAASL